MILLSDSYYSVKNRFSSDFSCQSACERIKKYNLLSEYHISPRIQIAIFV